MYVFSHEVSSSVDAAKLQSVLYIQKQSLVIHR